LICDLGGEVVGAFGDVYLPPVFKNFVSLVVGCNGQKFPIELT